MYKKKDSVFQVSVTVSLNKQEGRDTVRSCDT